MEFKIQPESPEAKCQHNLLSKDGPLKLPKSKICINLTDAKYDVIHHVCKKVLKWQIIQNDEENMNCDIIWNDTACNQDLLGRLKPFQKLNHFPGIFSIARKNFLCIHLNKMKKAFPTYYKFFPKSFNLPIDKNLLIKEFEDKKKNHTFIVKPEALSMGRGIFLTKRLEEIPLSENLVVQKYVQKPFLIDNLKFDLRIYVLVTSVSPLKIFIYKEGLARFATEEYIQPDHKNVKNICQHLTNYSINKNSKNFKFDENPLTAETGHKRSLASIWKYCEQNGIDSKAIFNDIKKGVIKTICSIQPILKHCYTSCQPNDFTGGMCFEVLGFDVIIKNNYKAYVLEVNHAPSFNSDTPYDFKVKSALLKNVFDIIDCNIEQRNFIIEKEHQIVEDRFKSGVRRRMTLEEKEKARNEYAVLLDKRIEQNIGQFELIYPMQNPTEPYEEFMKYSENLLLEATGVKNNKVKRREKTCNLKNKISTMKANNENIQHQNQSMPDEIKALQKMKLEKIQEAVNRLYSKKSSDIEQAQKERIIKLKTHDDLLMKKYEALKTNIVTLEFLPNIR